MRLGIQAKLVTTLVLAGLLPLILSLVIVLAVTQRIRTRSVGQSFRAAAQQGASQLSVMLSAQTELISLLSDLPGTVEFLAQANAIAAPTTRQISDMESRWADARPDDPLLGDILHNPLAQCWRKAQQRHPRFAEVIVTDRAGRLVAATNKTSDYFQADEAWWQQTVARKKSFPTLLDIQWDESAISMRGGAGALVTMVCAVIPALHDPDEIAGVMKISLDTGWVIQQLSQTSQADERMALQTWLVQSNGQTVDDASAAPMAAIPEGLMRHIRLFRAGWTPDSGIESLEMLGFAAVQMPGRDESTQSPAQWFVVVAASRDATLGPVRRMIGTILAVGLAGILICFLIGVLIARREVVRPLMLLSDGANKLERGNFAFRLPAPPSGRSNESFRDDELGELARDFNRMAEVLQQNLERLREAADMKQQFIDLASHELRTPVTYLVGVSDLARRRLAPDDAQRGVMEKIHARALRLSRIVENMFKLLKSGRFQAELARVPIDLPAMLQGVCRELDGFLHERQQRWNLRVEGSLPPVVADAEKLHDVLSNLLSNAIRFSPDGQTIDLTLSRDGDQYIRLIVTDHGPGIPQADLPRIFEPFFTAEIADAMHHTSGEYAHMTRGMGLGLSVVKRFVEMHGGSVSVASSPQGSEFTVRLPI